MAEVGVLIPDLGVEVPFVEKPLAPFVDDAEVFAPQVGVVAAGCLVFEVAPRPGKSSSDCVSNSGLVDDSSFRFPAAFVDIGGTHPGAGKSSGDSRTLEDSGGTGCVESASSGMSSTVTLCAACFCMSLCAADSSTPLPCASAWPFCVLEPREAMVEGSELTMEGEKRFAD